MKGHKIRFLSVIATFMLISSILSSQALAVARSSKYLDAYGTYVSPVGNGKIVITIDVDALRSMTKLVPRQSFSTDQKMARTSQLQNPITTKTIRL